MKNSAHKMALYYHHATRSGQVVTDMIGDYSEYLQTDGYSAYNSDKGADASARCYSIIESANLNDLNVFGYLSYLLTELPKLGEDPRDEQLDRLMPWSEVLPGYCKNV